MKGMRNIGRILSRCSEMIRKAALPISITGTVLQSAVILAPSGWKAGLPEGFLFPCLLFVQTVSGLFGLRAAALFLGAAVCSLLLIAGMSGPAEVALYLLFTFMAYAYRFTSDRKNSGKDEEILDSMVIMRSFRETTDRILDLQKKITDQEVCVNEKMDYIRQAIEVFAQKSEGLFFSSLALTPKVDASASQLTELMHSSGVIRNHLATQQTLISENLAAQEEMVPMLDNLTRIISEARLINESMSKNVAEGAGNISSAFEEIKRLEAKQKKSSEIIEIITGISDQINVLAINTAIEAARAGKYGSGFGIVSKEIRKLADATSRHSVEISGLIRDMNESITSSGSSISSAEEHLNLILSGIHDSVPMMDKIALTMSGIMGKDREMLVKGRDLLDSAKIAGKHAAGDETIVGEYADTFAQLKMYLDSLSLTIDTLRDQNERAMLAVDALNAIREETQALNGSVRTILQRQVHESHTP